MNKSTAPRDSEFRKILKGHIAVSGLTQNQVAENLGITGQTLINWLNCPGLFRLAELRRVCDMLRISPEDRRKLL